MQQRLEMIESIYNIKPQDIIARVALESMDGTAREEKQSKNRQTKASSPVDTQKNPPNVQMSSLQSPRG